MTIMLVVVVVIVLVVVVVLLLCSHVGGESTSLQIKKQIAQGRKIKRDEIYYWARTYLCAACADSAHF